MRYQSIDPLVFKKNRKKLLGRLENNAVAIVHSNDEMNRTGDQNFRYRQSSNMFYLTGIEQEKTVLVLLPGHPDEKMREILFIRKGNKSLETWEGQKLTLAGAAELSGIKNVKWLDGLNTLIQEQLIKRDLVYVDVPEYHKYRADNRFRGERFLRELRDEYPLHLFGRLFPVISDLRKIKEPEEVELIKKACEITGAGFYKALRTIKPAMMEYQVEALLTYEFIFNGASGHAYHPIVASGENACVLHYITNNKPCKDGDLVLMDFGAEYANYASDLTRTIPVNGRFNKRQRALYDATLRVYRFALQLIKPGTTINKIHQEVCRKWEDEHISLGLYSIEDLKKNNGDDALCQRYYMHGTSHFMGLDVHDAGGKDDILKPGMVLTCEPGIYIPEENTGIRIETDVLITETGIIDLMEKVPVEPEEIENIMNK
ncbi:MAG: aminopeptidase P N-terminal domain-containing protein [Bacteroidales bacterium]|nr:aminopeptidase P N-terminal domain-containing protein [Bacteroidales bacterium]